MLIEPKPLAVTWSAAIATAPHHGQDKNYLSQDTSKLLEENRGKTFSDINLTNVFLGQSSKATDIKAKINQWDLIKPTSFGTAKETNKKTKRQLTEWEKIVSNDATDKGLISKIDKQLI